MLKILWFNNKAPKGEEGKRVYDVIRSKTVLISGVTFYLLCSLPFTWMTKSRAKSGKGRIEECVLIEGVVSVVEEGEKKMNRSRLYNRG